MANVLFIPGFPGSELRLRESATSSKRVFVPRLNKMVPLDSQVRDLLQGPDSLAIDDGVFANEPVKVAARFFGVDLMKQAESLYDCLEELGIRETDVLKLGWDWRRPVTDDAHPHSCVPALENLLASQTTPVTVLVHSTGGLLLRRFLETHPALVPKVTKVIAFGVPWAGTVKSLAVLLGRQGFGPISASDAQGVISRAWAAFDLLPRAAGAGIVVNPSGAEVSLVDDTSWTQALANDPNGTLGAAQRLRAGHSLATLGTPTPNWTLPIDVVNIVGWGKKTLVRAVKHPGGQIDLSPADLDNEPSDDAEDRCLSQDEAIYQGDGTVPVSSAAWLSGSRVTTFFVPIGAVDRVTFSNRRHSELWRNVGADVLLRHHLQGAPLPANAVAAVDWSDKVDPGAADVRIRYVMQGADGQALPGATPTLVEMHGGDIACPLDQDGRGFIKLARSQFRRTPTGRFRRVTMALRWNGDPNPDLQRMFIEV